jgi:hypothetical protein
MTWTCMKCESPIGVQFNVCNHCGSLRVGGAPPGISLDRGHPLRIRYSTRMLLLAMTALAPTFLVSPSMWQQILMALATGAIATAVGIFLTRTLIDWIYRGLDRWNGRW